MSEVSKMQPLQEIFFPSHKQQVFHRINMEYLVPLQAGGSNDIYRWLERGIRTNLQNRGCDEQLLQGLQSQLHWQAQQLHQQGERLRQDRQQQRQQLLSHSRGDFSLYRAGMGVDFAHKKLAEALDSSDAQQGIELASGLLQSALSVNEQNYRAHFELGWIYLFTQEKLSDALWHFNVAAAQAAEYDPAFAVFVRRHLADAYYSLQDFGQAAETTLALLHDHTEDKNPEIVYESSRYLAACGEHGQAVEHLTQVITQAPVYHAQAQAEPDFVDNAVVNERLQLLHNSKVDRIQTSVEQGWQDSPLSTMKLPDQIDAGDLFQQVCQQHSRVMIQLPYTTLIQREHQIGQQILDASAKRIVREVQLRSRHYEQVAEKQRSRWSWVNQLGGALIHISAILLLAALMFYLLRFVLDLAGIGYLFNPDSTVSLVLGGMLLLGISGVTLAGFVPFGMNKLLRKQVELDNTVRLIRSS